MLMHLDLWWCDLSDYEMVELAKGQWPLFGKLSLHNNGMGLEGMTALVKADWPLLRMLNVSCYDQGCDDDTITTLMSADPVRELFLAALASLGVLRGARHGRPRVALS